MSDELLADKVSLITAAGGAIGRATALRFARSGARVACADLNAEAAEGSVTAVREAGGEAIALTGDVLRAADCQAMVEATLATFGQLNILINLVGYFGPRGGGTMDEIDLDRWQWMMDINLKSVFMASRAAIPAILAAGGGAIVNTGTLAAVIARGGGGGAYGGSKSGVLSLTRAMAADYLLRGIRVNCVCPSGTDTPMYWASGGPNRSREAVVNSLQGLSSPEQIAESFLFLASDVTAPRVTGHNLMADNGFSSFRM
jgi:NAD(P)-dependent dehydrogenase (short-subunit alcohol dehydrogenase family)